MTQKTFSIPKISCGHCVSAIQRELSEMGGVTSVAGNPDAKTIDVEWEPPATESAIRDLLQEINYPAA